MPASRPRLRVAAVGASAFALVAVAAGGTFAASNPATLYACYDAYGNVRMGDTAQCKLPGGGRLVNWSTAQVPGPTGATGPTGPTGPTGATGPAGPDPRFGTGTNWAASGSGRECTLGEIILTAGSVANGVPANGQLLPINMNQALFALLGTTYGGDGQVTFALPDLRGVAPNDLTYSICMQGIFPSRD